MFHQERAIKALEAKAGRFAGYELELSDALVGYEQVLTELAGLSRAQIEAREEADRVGATMVDLAQLDGELKGQM